MRDGRPAITALRLAAEIVDSPRDGTVGVPAAFTVRAKGPRSGARLRVSAAGAKTDEVVLPSSEAGSGPVVLTPACRGVFPTAVLILEVEGPIGLCRWRRRFDARLLVPCEVGPFPAPHSQKPPPADSGPRSVGMATAAEGSERSRGIRVYQAGDPIRLVHWPATARWGHPMVREVEGEGAGALHLVVDLRGAPDSAEATASEAAGTGRAFLAEGRTVILHTAEVGGPRSGVVRTPRELGRRLARAVTTAAPMVPPEPGSLLLRAGARGAAARQEATPTVPRETMLARLARINARQAPEEDWRVRVAAFVAVMTAALAVLTQDVGGPGFRLVVMAGIPIGFAFSWWSRHKPGYLTKLALAVAAVAGLLWFLKTIAGITGGTVADAQTPLAELVLLVQVVQTFDATASRDLRFSVLVSVVVMAAAGLLSISLSLLPFLALWAVAAVATLVLSHQSVLTGHPALAPMDRERNGRHARPGGRVTLPTSVTIVAALLAGLLLFMVVPAAGTARALTFPAALARIVPIASEGGLENPSLGTGDPAGRFAAEARSGLPVPPGRLPFGYFGFSTQLDLAARGRPDNTVVMRVKASHAAMWLGQAFDVWDGRRWTDSNQRTFPVDGPIPLRVLPPTEQGAALATGLAFIQTYYVLQPGPNIIFSADPPTEVYLPAGHLDELTDGTLRSSVELGQGAIYTVVSHPVLATPQLLRRADSGGALVPPDIVERYARVTPTTPRVHQLATAVTATAPTTYDKVLALEAWMGAHTRYSLNPPPLPPGADAVDQFLFVDRKGFCEQIATSLVVMLRSLGVPSRLAIGYAGGTRDPLTGVFDVRASDAHAWAEVWFPGIGWQSFDPTASVPLAGDASASAASGLAGFLSGHLPSVPAPLAVGLGGGAGVGLAALGARRLVRLRRRRRRERECAPAPSWAAVCQQRLEAAMAGRSRSRHGGETIHEYVAALADTTRSDAQLRDLADLVDRSVFSDDGPSADERAWAAAVLEELEGAGAQIAVRT